MLTEYCKVTRCTLRPAERKNGVAVTLYRRDTACKFTKHASDEKLGIWGVGATEKEAIYDLAIKIKGHTVHVGNKESFNTPWTIEKRGK